MRTLNVAELEKVSGGCNKNNNGYGNGPESGPPPGNSGGNEKQWYSDNSGPKGCR